MNAADESVAIVDEHNRVVGAATRREVWATDSPQHLYPGFQLCQSTLPAQALERQKTSIPGSAIRRSGEWFWQERAMTRVLGVNSKKSSV
jgi:hypothetical protein